MNKKAITAATIVATIVYYLLFFCGGIPTSFLKLVPDAVVTSTVREYQNMGYYSSPSAGRFAVFETVICPHYEVRGDDCDSLLYAEYSGGEGYLINGEYGKFLPEEQEEVSKTRDVIMEIAREYLRSPDRLKSFYMGYRGIALDATHKMLSTERRIDLVRAIEWFLEGMKLSKEPSVTALAESVLSAEEEFDLSWRDDNTLNALREADEALRLALGDDKVSWRRDVGVRFALRRFKEGGSELVNAWIEIGEDFLTAIR